jgi:hypothetical protein
MPFLTPARPGQGGRDAAKPNPRAGTLTTITQPSQPGTITIPLRLGTLTATQLRVTAAAARQK